MRLLCLVPAHSITFFQQFIDGSRIIAGGMRVKLVAAPDHLNLLAVFKSVQRFFKTAPSDITPRAGNIRPDFDFHDFLSSQLLDLWFLSSP